MQELLELLEKNPSLTPGQLAIMLGKPEEEIAAIIKRLEAEKIIVKYQTIVNWEKAGVDWVTAIIDVKITPQREVGFDAIAERIYRFPEVRSLYLMSGAYDLLLFVAGRDLKEVALFVSEKLATIEGVISTSTHFMLKTYKHHGLLMEIDHEDERLKVSP